MPNNRQAIAASINGQLENFDFKSSVISGLQKLVENDPYFVQGFFDLRGPFIEVDDREAFNAAISDFNIGDGENLKDLLEKRSANRYVPAEPSSYENMPKFGHIEDVKEPKKLEHLYSRHGHIAREIHQDILRDLTGKPDGMWS